MSFLDKMRPQFSSAARQGGELFFSKGLVDIRILNSDKIEATVKGDQKYTVGINLGTSSHVEMSCTCSSFLDWGENCKHLWAAIVEADQKWRAIGSWQGKERRDEERRGKESAIGAWDSGTGALDVPQGGTGALEVRNRRKKSGYKAPAPTQNHSFSLPELRRGRDWRILLPEEDNSSPKNKQAKGSSHQFFPFFILDRELSLQRGQVILNVEERYLKKTGEWGKSRSVRFELGKVLTEKYSNPADRRAMELVLSLKNGREHLAYRYHYDSFRDKAVENIPIPTTVALDLLPILEATDRLYLRINEIDKTNYFQTKHREIKLKFSQERLWHFKILFEENEEEDGYQLCPLLTRQGLDQPIPLVEPDIIFAGDPHWFIYEGRIHQISTKVPFNWIRELRKPVPISIDRADVLDFFQNIDQQGKYSLSDIFILPRELELKKIQGLSPDPELYIITSGRELWAHLTFRYGEDYHADSRNPSLAIHDFNRRVQVQRDLSLESACMRQLQDLGFTPQNNADYEWSLSSDTAIKALQSLLESNRWHIQGRGKKKIRLPSRFQFTVATGIDWFDVHGEIEFDEQAASLRTVLNLEKEGERFVPLGDGTLGILPEAWLQRNRFALNLGESQSKAKDDLRFSFGQTGLLDFILTSGEKVTVDDQYRRIRDCLQNFQGIRSVDIPPGFQGTLRPYQKKGLDWLVFLHEFGFGGCLADDMGLGKTIQVLALLEHVKQEGSTEPSLEHVRQGGSMAPSLVVVPTSLVFNWQREAQRFTPHMRVLSYTGSQRRELMKDFGKFDLIITTYGILRRDILPLREFEFNYLILDEAQVIKNHQTQVAKASSLINARHRLSLTGTPLENHLGELWSQFEFLNPSLLGGYGEFIHRFGNPSRLQNPEKPQDSERYQGPERHRDSKRYQGSQRYQGSERYQGPERCQNPRRPQDSEKESADRETEQAGQGEKTSRQEQVDLEPLRRLVSPFLLRRTKEDVEPELPEKTVQVVYCDMTEGQRVIYNQFRERYRASLLEVIDQAGINQSRFKVLEGLLRLRQICCHPVILSGFHSMEKGSSSGKFLAFQEMLDEVIEEGHKALVFSQFTSMLRIMRRWLDQNDIPYQYLDGRVRDRDQCVRQFQEDQDCKLFLISLKAGGFGLNLTAADYVFLYDPWWNPAVEMQAIDRTHRIGQQRRVFTYRFITRDSVEEKIQDLQEQKRDLVRNVIHSHESLVKQLTRDDIMALFS
ncbi:MAG: SNF2-related protein [bacterium]